MKFQVALRDLDAAMQIVTPALASGSNDLTGHYIFRRYPKDPSKVEILTGSGRVYASAPLVADIQTDGSFSVEGKSLRDWLAAMNDDSVMVFEFNPTTKEVTVGPLGDTMKVNYFQSLEPSHYQWWDEMLKNAVTKVTVNADRFREAFTFAKSFVIDDETNNPNISVLEVRDATLLATTKLTLSMITIPEFAQSNLRLHIRDVAAVLSFANQCKGGDLEVLEHDRSFFFRRADGATFVVGRFTVSFPQLARPKDADDYQWRVPVDVFKRALRAVTNTASNEDEIRISRPDPTGPILLSFETKSRGRWATFDVPCLESKQEPNAPILPDYVTIKRANVKRMLDAVQENEIYLGVNIRGKNGYFRTVEKRGDDSAPRKDEFLVMLAWKTNA
jgi:hypothetical protein